MESDKKLEDKNPSGVGPQIVAFSSLEEDHKEGDNCKEEIFWDCALSEAEEASEAEGYGLEKFIHHSLPPLSPHSSSTFPHQLFLKRLPLLSDEEYEKEKEALLKRQQREMKEMLDRIAEARNRHGAENLELKQILSDRSHSHLSPNNLNIGKDSIKNFAGTTI